MKGRFDCMSKKLTSSKILSLHSKTFTQKKIYINVENEQYEVLIDTKFKISKIQELLAEVVEKTQQLLKLKDIFNIPYYINFLIIKYFTNVEITKVQDFSEQLRVYKAMLDLGIFDQIMEAFDEKEVEKIGIYLKKMNENLKKLDKNPEVIEDINAMIADLASIENPEVFVDDEENGDKNATV